MPKRTEQPLEVANPHLTVVREPEPRWELIARIRQEIENGTYITPEKLEIALGHVSGSSAGRG